MERSKFSDISPGTLVQASGEWTFVPNALPPTWQIPNELWPLVVEANRQLAILEGMGRYLPNPAILLRPLEDREAIQSSRIEGTYATARELLLFEKAPREAVSESDRVNDWREVHNYRKALQWGAASELPISLRLIRELHRELLTGVRGTDRRPGEFRTAQVAIGVNHRFMPPAPTAVMQCLDQLEKYIHETTRSFDSLIECFLVHYQFETIHPFLDGNGRVGRLLLALMIQRMCGLSKPWLYMSSFFEKHRDEYVDLLFNVSAKNHWEAWVTFCLEGTISQCKDTVNRCNRLLEIKDKYAGQIASIKGGSNRLAQIVDMMFQSPFVAIAELAATLGVYYQTAQADVERLRSVGMLRQLADVYPKTYYAPEIYGVAYEDLGDIEQ